MNSKAAAMKGPQREATERGGYTMRKDPKDRSGEIVKWKGIEWILDLHGQVYTLKAFGLGGGFRPKLGATIAEERIASGEMCQ